jgi:hypothetical protein
VRWRQPITKIAVILQLVAQIGRAAYNSHLFSYLIMTIIYFENCKDAGRGFDSRLIVSQDIGVINQYFVDRHLSNRAVDDVEVIWRWERIRTGPGGQMWVRLPLSHSRKGNRISCRYSYLANVPDSENLWDLIKFKCTGYLYPMRFTINN